MSIERARKTRTIIDYYISYVKKLNRTNLYKDEI